jgi:predicted nucleic acid-binding protein
MKGKRAIPRLFLDTSALFTGIWPAAGGGRMLLKMGEARAVDLLVSPQVLAEIERAVRRKAPERLGVLALLLDRSGVQIVKPALSTTLSKVNRYLDYVPDAMILASAIDAQSDYFVTRDKRHFLGIEDLTRAFSPSIGTPGDCLAWYKRSLTRN